jgi:hypothetical protein
VAVSAKVLGPRQGRFRIGHETLHDLGCRQHFLNYARSLPGSEQSLVRPTGLVRRQYLAPQAIAVAARRLALPVPMGGRMIGTGSCSCCDRIPPERVLGV